MKNKRIQFIRSLLSRTQNGELEWQRGSWPRFHTSYQREGYTISVTLSPQGWISKSYKVRIHKYKGATKETKTVVFKARKFWERKLFRLANKVCQLGKLQVKEREKEFYELAT